MIPGMSRLNSAIYYWKYGTYYNGLMKSNAKEIKI